MVAPELTVGLAGGMCSGKNTFGEFLVEHYGAHFGAGGVISSSDAAREFIAKMELGEPTRDLTRVTSTRLRQDNSPTYMLDWAISQFEDSVGLRIVSGIYTMPELHRVHDLGGVVVAMHTDEEMRANRMTNRSRHGEMRSDDFKRLDEQDMNASETDQRAASVIDSADIHLYDTVGTRGDYTTLYQVAARQIFSHVGLVLGD